ncbi:HAMP domain-containing histidine kinase [Chryseobacterium sp. SNU WT5]|uniref:sensor histidine kinase n=1 Tax=Chryseobacterium sp. SNU WT5 TaxID=2594269 RepID=UPI00117ECD69|nr:HAMP domain-containing sensor histidine kinase [Chryseobacterium sp. SNU WT5]QDP84262.1 HAMP domain-containing histidine kinase [Chryseobacterium sp. SNU WT5]
MRKTFSLSSLNNWFVFILLTLIVLSLTLASNYLVKKLRQKEIERMHVFTTAMQILQENVQLDDNIQNLLLAVLEENNQIPVIVTDESRIPYKDNTRNLPEEIINNPMKLKSQLRSMESSYKPIKIKISDTQEQLVFYDNSNFLNNLRYYPYGLAFLIGTYLLFSFWFLRTIKKTDEGYVWAGLAKETAHQIGTPLSSMIGWIEIMRMENPNSEGVKEIENDINRLKTISERFSKIGSVPELKDLNINETIQQNYDYLKSRISRKVQLMLVLPKEQILIPHNRILLSWVIENIVKNAVDAMKGEGRLEVNLYEKNKHIIIDIIDSGSGMTRSQIRNAFKAGFSTKKRGWGLGLSLAKRVIKEYHNGDIKIAASELGTGTTFRIMMKNS